LSLPIGLGLNTPAPAAGLNDTGRTTCYDDTQAVTSEPSTHPRQDCTIGRDAAAAAGVLTKVGGGHAGFDYTKIANDGRELPADAVLGSGPGDWACTRDNVTDVLWEVKTDDRGLRYGGWSYTWYDDIHTDNNGGDPGSLGGNTCGGTLPNSQCNTQAYAAAVNAVGLCGFTDWRLPTANELFELVGLEPGAYIDTNYFKHSGYNWSSSVPIPITTRSRHAVIVAPGDTPSNLRIVPKNYVIYDVRLARGGPTGSSNPSLINKENCYPNIQATTPTEDFILDDLNGTATHAKTGLTWMRCSLGQTWDSATRTCSGSAHTYTWGEALRTAQGYAFAGYNDWRVPNIKELLTIFEDKCIPHINEIVFDVVGRKNYWSSSQSGYPESSSTLHLDAFFDSRVVWQPRIVQQSVRLVRGGSSFSDYSGDTVSPPPTPTATLPVPTARDLPSAVTNVPYATVINAAGGISPYIFTAAGLPPGLRLTADDGVLSGIPDTAGEYTVTVTVTDAQSQTGTRDYAITVAPLVLVQRSLPIGVRNAPYTQTLTALGGQPPYTFTATGLPPGLTLAVNGAISGTPTEAHDAPIQVTVQDQDEQTITQPVWLTIREVAFTRANPVKPGQTISAAVQYPDGRSCELDEPNILTLPLGGLNAPATGPQGITLTDGLLQVVLQNCTTNGIPATVTLAYGDPLPAGAQYWKYGPTATDPDPHWYLLNGADLAGNTATFTLIDGHLGDADGLTDAHITDPGGRGLPNLAISGGILSRTPVNQPYRATLQARYEGPAPPATAADDPAYRWSVTEGALPPGLTLETATPDGLDALLSGVPTQVGVYFFTLQVIDPTHGQVFVQQDYRIEVIADDPAVTLITHYYRSILDRAPEDDGVAFWKDQITALQAQGQDAKPVFRNMAYFFFNSPEYLARHTTNPAFIGNLYRTFFQREPEEDGLAFWLEQLAEGSPRNDVMTFFLYSQEFTDFMGYLGF